MSQVQATLRGLVLIAGLVSPCAAVALEPNDGSNTAAAAAGPAQTNGTATNGLEALVHWLTERGGFVHPSVRVARLEGQGWDLRLAEGKTIPKGAILISVPPSAQLSYARFQATIGGPVERQVPKELWDMRLALALLAAAADTATWGPFVQMLPQSLPGLPIFWKGSMLSEVEEVHPTLRKEVVGRAGVLKSVAQGLKAEATDGDGECRRWERLSLRTLAWAYGIVTSRSVRLDKSGAGAGVLLPLIDLANHQFVPTAEIRRQDKGADVGSACLVTARALHGGERLTLSYGKYSNLRLRLDYGFEVEGNTYKDAKIGPR